MYSTEVERLTLVSSPINYQTQLNTILLGFLGSPTGAATATHGGVTAANVGSGGLSGIPGMQYAQQNQTYFSNSKVNAFINVIFFDEQFKAFDFRVSKVGEVGVTRQHLEDLQDILVGKNGYVYIYCSNESPMNVYFDNLQVIHRPGPVLEETHYYPFGLTMAGISSKAAGKLENNKQKFQGQEFINDFDISMYEFKYRMDDCQTGRFWQVDPLAEDYVYNSTYAFSENKVTTHIELEGLEAIRFDASKYENRGESTQIRRPVDLRNATTSQATPAVSFTVSKGPQVGVKVAGVGVEANFGSKEIMKVTDVDPGSNQADNASTKKGWGIGIGVVGASKDISSKSVTGTDRFGNPTVSVTSEVNQSLSIGIKKTPISAGVERTWTVEQSSPFYQQNVTSDTGLQPSIGGSKSPGVSGANKKGTEFSLSLYYKVDIKVDVKQVMINIFNSFNTGAH